MRIAPILAFAIVLFAACKKKHEILPDDAKQVSRSDKTETDGVSLREYQFTVKDKSGVPQKFVCEAREFSNNESAALAAKKSIAERPQEELKSQSAHFALSGRSVWLRAKEKLVWCMLATGRADELPVAMESIRALFMRHYREAA